ncbi:twin-arginine translocase subunit TatC, partial [Xanthomonas citri pv. citri]|nr:twin-arginine translocase subunit TatC [Xanthomonas citri pv. citri]
TSPWVFYQAWAFIGAGLYRHERHYVVKFLPFSLSLFLAGVFLCFFGVLPYTLGFLLQFNVWLGIEPTMRITDWMSFAT